jgi:hypothetical protein
MSRIRNTGIELQNLYFLPHELYNLANVTQSDVVVACGKLVRYSRHLASHVEPLLVELGPPWALAASSAQPQVAYFSSELLTVCWGGGGGGEIK